jgi:hypothetical protein
MKRFSLTLLCLICSLSLLIGSPHAEGNPVAELRIVFKGLPQGVSDGVLTLCIIHLEAGKVTEITREDPTSEMSIDVPAGPLVFQATYFSSSSDVFLMGMGSGFTVGDDSIEIVMGSSPSDLSPDQGSLPTYPPDEGIAIGYNPADFTATGPGAESRLGEGFAGVVVTELSRSPCAASDSAPYQIVESANPKGMALIEAELKLQADPSFDPASKVTPHIIAATHLVKGTFDMGDESIVVDLRVEDLEGNAIAHATASGSIDSAIETVEEAARSLADELCKK